jgi:hypothetical protein
MLPGNDGGVKPPRPPEHSGFTLKVLIGTLRSNGFPSAAGKRRTGAFDLWAVASKKQLADDELRELAGRVLPG